MERLEIKTSITRLTYYILFSGALTIFLIVSLLDNAYQNKGVFIIFLIIISLLFVYYINQLINRHPIIILTHEGIEFRDYGFYSWTSIDTFRTKTMYFKPFNQFLIFNFKDSTRIEINISDLELSNNEIVKEILTFQDTSNVVYLKDE